MMTFNSINEFINFRNKCIICGSKFNIYINGLFDGKNISRKSKYENDVLKFKNNGCEYSFNCIDNSLTMTNLNNGSSTQEAMFALFVKAYPNIELNCNSCNKYSVVSRIITVSDNKVQPFKLSWESFHTDPYWVQNDWDELKTKIYSISSSVEDSISDEPIVVDIIPFDGLTPSQLLKKIKTIVTFS